MYVCSKSKIKELMDLHLYLTVKKAFARPVQTLG